MTSKEQIEQQQKIILELQKSLAKADAILAKKDEIISIKDEAILKKDETIFQKDATILQKDERIASLENSLDWFRKQLFGKKSEKKLPLNPNALQPSLFPDLLSEEEKSTLEKESQQEEEKVTKMISVSSSKRKKINTIDTSKLPVKEVVIEPTDINTDEYTRLGEEVSEKLIYEPSMIYVERTIRPKYVLKSSLQIENPDKQVFITAPLAPSPLNKCIASSSLLTEIILQKFQYHLPFYRVIQKFKEIGFVVSDSTIGDWYSSTCVLLKPIYDLLKEKILESDYIQVDESTLPVMDNEKRRAVKGYVWVVRDALSGSSYFHYANGSRSHSTARALLGTYRGAIQTDGYSAYDQFEESPGKVLLSCMAHCRRKFTEALNEDKARASQALVIIGKLYAIEKQAKEDGLTADELTILRKEKAYPIIQLFEKWLIDNYSKVLKSSLIGKAISYTYALLPRLSRYVLDGRYQLDNNLVEGAIRPLAIGRKNYLFCGSPASATRASMMYSFISSCKAANVDIRQWFTFAIENIASYKKDGKIELLLPQNFKSLK